MDLESQEISLIVAYRLNPSLEAMQSLYKTHPHLLWFSFEYQHGIGCWMQWKQLSAGDPLFNNDYRCYEISKSQPERPPFVEFSPE